MGQMSDISIDIQNMLEQGFRPATIASVLNVPLDWVYGVYERVQNEFTTN